MRKRLTFAVAIAVGTAVVLAGVAGAVKSPVLQGPNGNTQSLANVYRPFKLFKKKAQPISLDVKTATTSTNPSANNGAPIPAVEAIVDFAKGVKIFSKGYPTCNSGLIQNTSTEAALEACKRAKIGGGKGTADLVVGTKIFPVGTTITAFNGRPAGGKPVILLHTYSQVPIQTTIVLVGVVKNFNKGGYGPRLDVTIPLIAGGQGAVTGFQVKIFKKFRYRGKVRSYVSATCPSKKMRTRGRFIFLDGESLTPKIVQRCKQKPEKKKRKK